MANLKKNEKFVSKTFGSKNEFANEYRQTYAEVDKAKELYLFILKSLKEAVEVNDPSRLQNYGSVLELIHEFEKETNLSEFREDSTNVFKNTNLVILACMQEKEDFLENLFDNKSAVFKCLSEIEPLTPKVKDEFSHNAFYYAIRSGNVKMLKLLIKRWPDNYFKDKANELDEILSSAYEELKLKNVPLSDEMEIFIEKTILNIRFFSNNETTYNKSIKNDPSVNRIQMVVENIYNLKSEYQKKSVDSIFIFKVTFIAQNVHILKQQLKFTYDKIPWEEIEFILISFISSFLKKQEINLFYKAILNKDKILSYLQKFAEFLQWEKDSIECGYNNNMNVLKFKRQNVVKAIIEKHPDMKDLYDDFQQIRDVHSLEKISEYIKLALSSDPKKNEGQLIIIRVIQVIGEYLKNTLESPNLSEKTSDIFLRTMQRNMREIIVDLRNSLSHAYSLSKRTELQQINDEHFFKGVQNDMRFIDNEISDILYKYRFELAKTLLWKTRKTEDIEEFKEIAEIAKNIRIDYETQDTVSKNEHKKLETLLKEFSKQKDTTKNDSSIIDKVKNIINKVENKCALTKKKYMKALKALRNVGCLIKDAINKDEFTKETYRSIYYLCEETLCSLEDKAEKRLNNELVRDVLNLCKIHQSNSENIKTNILREITNYLFILIEVNTLGDINCIEELRESLCNKESFVAGFLKKKYCDESTDYSDQLSSKLNELKTIIKNNSLGYSIEKLKLYKDDKKLQAVIEMLVLDIMSILGSSKNYLENNLFFLDDNSPLLTGKCLRNHLAHDNILFDVLLFDPSISIILNARKLAEENIQDGTRKIGKPVNFNYLKLKEKYERGLIVIRNQNNLYKAAKKGNLRDFENCLRAGADIFAKDSNLWTTLHFAAQGPSLEIVKLILSHGIKADAETSKDENPLHIAASHGRNQIVKYLIKETSLKVDSITKKRLTPLHLAAQNGHAETVKLLLSLNATKFLKDKYAYSPLLKAVTHKRPEVVKILLEGETNVDSDQSAGGFTALCHAGEIGCLGSAKFLLQKGASVKAGSDFRRTPLHGAAFGGHFDVAKLLIENGAKVDAQVVDGATPLFYAVENGSNDLVELLIQHGANVNQRDKIYDAVPIIVAAKDGNTKIVETLLKNKADPNLVNNQGRSALHFAAEFGRTETVSVLLKNGINIDTKDQKGDTPLQYAAYAKHPKVVELLLKNNADLGITASAETTPLHTAAGNGCKEIIELLIKKGGFDIDTEDNEGRSALLIASASADADVVDLLIKNHANANKESIASPLHVAASEGRIKNVELLLSRGAFINAKDSKEETALHYAARNGQAKIVELLIKKGAVVDTSNAKGDTALHQAVCQGHLEVVKVLVANGASVKTSLDEKSLLVRAMRHNVEMIEFLISSGAEIDKPQLIQGGPFSVAVTFGSKKLVEVFLKRKEALANSYLGSTSKTPILIVAAQLDHAEIVKLLIAYGANVNAVDMNNQNCTALEAAVLRGSENAVQVLIDNGARVNGYINCRNIVQRLSPLHIAVFSGYNDIVKMLLNCNKTDVNAKDSTGRTPLVWAIENNKVSIAKEFHRCGKFKSADKFGPDLDWTFLHVCAENDQSDNTDMAKYLVNEMGIDINARSKTDAKAIHVAARAGQKNMVKFLIEKGLSVDEPGMHGQSPLFYAAIKGQIKVAEYLISKGANVNLKDRMGCQIIDLAAGLGQVDFVKLLLQNGAINTNASKCIINPNVGSPEIKPIGKGVSDVINLTDRLFDAVKKNNMISVKGCIKDGAAINAKNSTNSTPLHFACWKGYPEIVEILVETGKCDLNSTGDKGYTPLHYAAKFGHYEIVKTLLSNGAIYNVACESGKTPLDFATDKKTVQLLEILHKSFKNIEENSAQFIDNLKKIKDKSLKKAILRALNVTKETLIVAAERRKYSKLQQLKETIYGEMNVENSKLDRWLMKGEYDKALKTLKEIFDYRKEVLGCDDPGTLEVLHQVGKTYYMRGSFMEAKKSFENVYNKRKDILGSDHADTLKARSDLALVFHRLGKNEESIKTSKEVLEKQKKVLGPKHTDTMSTYFNLGIALQIEPGKTEEALKVYQDCLEMSVNDHCDSRITNIMNNIGMCQSALGRYEEAAKTLEAVYQLKKEFFGADHAITIRTIINIAGIYENQKNIPKAIEWYKKGIALQKRILGLKHPETLISQFNFGTIMMKEGKILSAYKAYHEILEPTIEVYGPNNQMVTTIKLYMENLNKIYAPQGKTCGEIVADLQQELIKNVESGEYEMVKHLLDGGAELGVVDYEGRSALHFAASKGHVDIVKLLINFSAEVTLITKKGNTALHMACLVKNEEIVDLLIKSVVSTKLRSFINAKTIAGNTTALHVAAKNGSYNIVKTLLKNGAIFNPRNKDRKTPANLCTEEKCTRLFNLIDSLFENLRNEDDNNFLERIKNLSATDFLAVANARNADEKTLLQVATVNKRKNIAEYITKTLRQCLD